MILHVILRTVTFKIILNVACLAKNMVPYVYSNVLDIIIILGEAATDIVCGLNRYHCIKTQTSSVCQIDHS